MKELNELHSEALKEEKNKKEHLTSSFITFVSRMFSNSISQRLSCFVYWQLLRERNVTMSKGIVGMCGLWCFSLMEGTSTKTCFHCSSSILLRHCEPPSSNYYHSWQRSALSRTLLRCYETALIDSAVSISTRWSLLWTQREKKIGLQTICSHVLLDHNVDDYLTGINCQIRGHHNISTIFTPAPAQNRA